MVSIVTDSSSDLSPDLVERFGIRVVPFPVHHGGRTYFDGVDINASTLYHLVDTTGELPKTSAPLVRSFIEAFDQPGDVIYLGLSSALSAAFQSALSAAQHFPAGKVRVIDSLNLSTGTGLLVLRAAEMRDQGRTAEEIESGIHAAIPKVRTAFVVDTLRYLHMGGRCTAVESIMGSLLHIRPLIAVEPAGTLGVRQKLRGTRRRALQAMIDDVAAQRSEIDLDRIFVTHSGSEDVQWVAGEVQRIASPKELFITQAGCTVCSHCGPNTTGILYLAK